MSAWVNDHECRSVAVDRLSCEKMPDSHVFRMMLLDSKTTVTDIEEYRGILSRERLKLRSCILPIVSTMMIKEARDMERLKYKDPSSGSLLLVQNLCHIGLAWAQSCDPENALKIWNIMWKIFDTAHVKYEIETQTMKAMKWVYTEPEPKASSQRTANHHLRIKGFVSKFVTEALNNLRKSMNKQSKTTHGWRIGISAGKNPPNQAGKGKGRRVKTVFLYERNVHRHVHDSRIDVAIAVDDFDDADDEDDDDDNQVVLEKVINEQHQFSSNQDYDNAIGVLTASLPDDPKSKELLVQLQVLAQSNKHTLRSSNLKQARKCQIIIFKLSVVL